MTKLSSKPIRRQIQILNNKINCVSCCDDTIATTELNPPVDAPLENDPTVLINLTEGIIWYWDGDSWEVGNAGGTDTNIANTNLTLDAARTHDLNSYLLKFNPRPTTNSYVHIGKSGLFDQFAAVMYGNGTLGSTSLVNLLLTNGNFIVNTSNAFGLPTALANINATGVRLESYQGLPIRILSNGDLVISSATNSYFFADTAGNPFLPVAGTPDKALGVVEADGQIVTYDVPVIDNLKLDQIGISIDGGGAVITTGIKGYITVPYSGTITGWTILEISDTPIAGDIVVDVWKDTYANYPPTVADTIITTKPTLSGVVKNQNNAPTFVGAGATVTAGDIIAFNVDSVATVEKVLVTLQITKF